MRKYNYYLIFDFGTSRFWPAKISVDSCFENRYSYLYYLPISFSAFNLFSYVFYLTAITDSVNLSSLDCVDDLILSSKNFDFNLFNDLVKFCSYEVVENYD